MFNKQRRLKNIDRLHARDGNNCGICRSPLGKKITFDHKMARSKGGSNRLSNLQLAHKICNRRKGNR